MLNTNTLKRLACQLSLGVLMIATPALGQDCTCPGDMNFDGTIDGADLGQLLGAWSTSTVDADLNHDGDVDGADLGAFLALWGPCGQPLNDFCSNAMNIEAGTRPFCTLHATESGPSFPSGCQSGITDMYKDVWFRYTATITGPLTVSTCDQGDYDTVLAVYGFAQPGTAHCPSLGGATLLGCNDDQPGTCAAETSRVIVNVTAGYIYMIRVGGFAGGGTGYLTVAPGQPGTSCINPVVIDETSIAAVAIAGNTNDNATDYSYTQPCFQTGFSGGPTEWVRWIAPCNGTVTGTTCRSGTDYDTVLTVLHANPGEACWSDFVVCNDDTNLPGCDIAGFNRKSRVQFAVQADHIYLFAVSGWNGAHGAYELLISQDCN